MWSPNAVYRIESHGNLPLCTSVLLLVHGVSIWTDWPVVSSSYGYFLKLSYRRNVLFACLLLPLSLTNEWCCVFLSSRKKPGLFFFGIIKPRYFPSCIYEGLRQGFSVAAPSSRSSSPTPWNMARDTRPQSASWRRAARPCGGWRRRCLAGSSGGPRLSSGTSCLRRRTGWGPHSCRWVTSWCVFFFPWKLLFLTGNLSSYLNHWPHLLYSLFIFICTFIFK